MYVRMIVLAWIIGAMVLPSPCQADVKSDFVNPPLKFRARPLWFWNNATVTAAEVEAQLQGNRDRSGYGGLAPLPFEAKFTRKYLSEEYFTLYGAAVTKARQLGMDAGALMLPWMVRSPRTTVPACTRWLRMADIMATKNATPQNAVRETA